MILNDQNLAQMGLNESKWAQMTLKKTKEPRPKWT